MKKPTQILKSMHANLNMTWQYFKCIVNRKTPALLNFELDSKISINGLPVLVIWKAENYYKVEINGIVATKNVVAVYTNSANPHSQIEIKVYGYNNIITESKILLNQTYQRQKVFNYNITKRRAEIYTPIVSALKKPIEELDTASHSLTDSIPRIKYKLPKFISRQIIQPQLVPNTNIEKGIDQLQDNFCISYNNELTIALNKPE
jgi:hypothetical protein